MKRSLAVALAAGLVFVGCGGELLSVWKVSLIAGTKPTSCFKDGKVTDPKSETTTIEDYSGNWELYKAANDKYQLRIGNDVFDGAATGDVYKFQGVNNVKVVDKPDSPTVTTTTTKEEDITLNMNGGAFTGTWAHIAQKRCEGTCAPTFQADNPDCTVTDQIKGTKIPVQIWHQE